MNESRKYLRFPIAQRIEHWVLLLSFGLLGFTGLVQKYSSNSFSQWSIEALGGIESVRIFHRVAAIVMMFQTIYHLVIIAYRLFIRRDRMSMLPELQDARVAIHSLLYNLGLRKDHPKQDQYTFEEKAEYWALIWGTLVMGVTGFMLWNPIITARLFPGEFIPAAKAAHGGEAVLAVLAIIVWHFYQVHIKHWNKSIFTGVLSEKEMLEEHPLELAAIKAAMIERPVGRPKSTWERWFFVPTRTAAPPVSDQQRRLFAVVTGVVVVGMLAGVYFFVNYEETAITTVPPAEQVAVYVPLTPTPLPTPMPTPTPAPTPTPMPTLEPDVKLTWSDGPAEMFGNQCGACHGSATRLGGLDLSSFQGLMAGGNSGAAIAAGDPDASALVTLLESGGHPGQLSAGELERIRQWIEDGALEK